MTKSPTFRPLVAAFWLLLVCTGYTGAPAQSAPAQSADAQSADGSRLQAITSNLRAEGIFGVSDAYPLADRMAHHGVPGVAIALIDDGRLAGIQGFGVLQAGRAQPITADTLFSVGSVSKVITAALALKLGAEGRLDIDRDVRTYLTSWALPAGAPPSSASPEPVTLRRIFSHTAGFNIHGFADFEPGAQLPSVYDTLNGTGPARHEPLRFVSAPGERYRYSGGGYTLAQLVLTDITNQSFADLARQRLFEPLSMARSSFANPLPEATANVAKAHNRSGRPVALPRGYEAMPEMAASGLWTSARELGGFVAALIESYRTAGGFLPQPIAQDMMKAVAPGRHGVGPRIDSSGPTLRFHHGGANNSYRAWIEGNLVTGNGMVVLTNGTNGDDLYDEIRRGAAALNEKDG